MERELRIIPKLEFIEWVYQNHPHVLTEYNSRGLEQQSPTADADDSNHQSDLNGNYRDK